MPEVRVVGSLAAIPRERWTACFPGELESYDYLLAIENAALGGFEWRYLLVSEGDRIVAAAPAFVTQYNLDTTMPAGIRRFVEKCRRLFPGVLRLRLAALGSPCTETMTVGFAPELRADERAMMLSMMLERFEREAASERCAITAIKDAPEPARTLWDAATRARGYEAIPGLPVAHLDIDFDGLQGYLARLSAATRKDMRRKLKSLNSVRIEVRSNIDDVIDQIMGLYRQTRARAEMKFEDLSSAYFSGVLKHMGENAICMLYYAEGRLLAANLLLRDDQLLLDKFFCMDGGLGRQYNLYFLSWFANVRYCLEAGLRRYQSGQAAYANKRRLASRLTRTLMYFRHRNPLINRALQIAAPALASELTQD